MRDLKALMGAPRPSPTDSMIATFGFPILGSEEKDKLAEGQVIDRGMDDRAIALICATVLEQSIERAMLHKLVPLSGAEERRIFSDDGAPLASFDAKIRIAFALGVIGPLARTDLGTIRSIRNAFAHSRLRINFDTPEVKAAVDQLSLEKRFLTIARTKDGARDRFIDTVAHYATYLICFDPTETTESIQNELLDIGPPPAQPTPDPRALEPERPKG